MNRSAHRRFVRGSSFVLVLLLTAPVFQGAAQEAPTSWLARILDPRSVGVAPFPDGVLNRKLSVDTIRFETNPRKQIVVYLAPLERLDDASRFFEERLGVKPQVTGAGSELEIRNFALAGGGEYPPAAEGLTIQLMRSPWATDQLQITMELVPKETPPAP